MPLGWIPRLWIGGRTWRGWGGRIELGRAGERTSLLRTLRARGHHPGSFGRTDDALAGGAIDTDGGIPSATPEPIAIVADADVEGLGGDRAVDLDPIDGAGPAGGAVDGGSQFAHLVAAAGESRFGDSDGRG